MSEITLQEVAAAILEHGPSATAFPERMAAVNAFREQRGIELARLARVLSDIALAEVEMIAPFPDLDQGEAAARAIVLTVMEVAAVIIVAAMDERAERTGELADEAGLPTRFALSAYEVATSVLARWARA